jgi:hypothetical protein
MMLLEVFNRDLYYDLWYFSSSVLPNPLENTMTEFASSLLNYLAEWTN